MKKSGSCSGTALIPATYGGKPVTAIFDNRFKDATALTELYIPRTVTRIGSYGLRRTSLSKAIIPESVTYIGRCAFMYKNLTSFTFPDGVETIAQTVLEYSHKLEYIIIPTSVTEIRGYIFESDATTDSFYKGTSEQFSSIAINADARLNDIYFYSASEPGEAGNYWHYVAGVPTKWAA